MPEYIQKTKKVKAIQFNGKYGGVENIKKEFPDLRLRLQQDIEKWEDFDSIKDLYAAINGVWSPVSTSCYIVLEDKYYKILTPTQFNNIYDSKS